MSRRWSSGSSARSRPTTASVATTAIPTWGRFYRMMQQQMCESTGGGCTYEGDDMRRTHAGMDITPTEFNAIVEALMRAMDAREAARRRAEPHPRALRTDARGRHRPLTRGADGDRERRRTGSCVERRGPVRDGGSAGKRARKPQPLVRGGEPAGDERCARLGPAAELQGAAAPSSSVRPSARRRAGAARTGRAGAWLPPVIQSRERTGSSASTATLVIAPRVGEQTARGGNAHVRATAVRRRGRAARRPAARSAP